MDDTPKFQFGEEPAKQPTPADAVPDGAEAAPKEGGGKPQSVSDIHIDELLHIIVDRNCSDLHISVNSEPVIREDGALKRLNFTKFEPQDTQRLMYEIITDEN